MTKEYGKRLILDQFTIKTNFLDFEGPKMSVKYKAKEKEHIVTFTGKGVRKKRT